MKRRNFIALLGGAAAWPLAAHAQQPERMKRMGVLVGLAEHDPEAKARLAGFWQAFERLGWFEGRNVLADYRYAPAGAGAHGPLVLPTSVAIDPPRTSAGHFAVMHNDRFRRRRGAKVG
jgi:putative ABC transport system substrate-binding protein